MRLNPNSRSFRVRTTITTRVSGKKNVRKSNMFSEILFCRLTVPNRDFTERQTCLRCFDKGDKTPPPPAITVRCDARVFSRQTAASLPRFSRRERVRSRALFHGKVSRYNFEVRFVTVSVELSTNPRSWKMIDDDHKVVCYHTRIYTKSVKNFLCNILISTEIRERFLHQLYKCFKLLFPSPYYKI